MHAEALAFSERYHIASASVVSKTTDVSWNCYSFPGHGAGLGVDCSAPSAFGQDELARTSKESLFSAAKCKAIIDEAESVCAWQSSGRIAHYATSAGCLTPLSEMPKSLRLLSPFIESVLLPSIKETFPLGCGLATLRISSARLVKYNASASQTQLGMHRDGPLVTATIALNGLDEYDGGGTAIEALAPPRTSLRVDTGHVVLHPGAVRHGGQSITRGVRYVLVFFLFDAATCDHDRYCMLKANALLARALNIQSRSQYRSDILAAAIQAFRAALALGAATEAAHLGLGQALLEAYRADEAVEVLRTAVTLAPTNAHAIATLAKAVGRDRAAEQEK